MEILLTSLKNVRPVAWVKAVVYVAVLSAVYLSPFKELWAQWGSEDYSHCWLIPFVILYLLWEKREELASPSRVSKVGFVPLALGIVLFWLGELAGEFYSMYISFWFTALGIVWLHFGWKKIKSLAFVFVVGLTMFPLPNILNVRVTFGLKLLSSQLGVTFLQLYGMPVYREGNIIDLGFTQLQVVDACSGLRYVFPLMVLSLLLAYWYKTHLWKRLVLFLSSIPLAIFVNGFRIAATGVLYNLMGAQAAGGFFHGFSGWLIFMFTIPVLLIEMWVLSLLPPRRKGDRGTKEEAADVGAPLDGCRSILPFVVVIVLLGGTFVFSHAIDFRERIPAGRSFKEFPTNIDEWSGKRGTMEQEFIDVLHFSDYVMADYTNSQGKSVNFYTAYYESQRKGEGTHSPETCLPGSGWLFKEAGTTAVPLGSGKSITIKRAFMEKSGQRELTYYWFPMRGRILTSLYQVKLYTFWDALTKHRTDGALVRLITPVYPNEELPQAEERLQEFTKDLVPVLKEYIPD